MIRKPWSASGSAGLSPQSNPWWQLAEETHTALVRIRSGNADAEDEGTAVRRTIYHDKDVSG